MSLGATPVPTLQVGEGEVLVEGDTCQGHFADFSAAGMRPSPFCCQTMHAFATSLGTCLEKQDGWVGGLTRAEELLPSFLTRGLLSPMF